MSLAIPSNFGQLVGLGTMMLNGLKQDGQALKITQITAAQLRAELDAFIGADGAYNAGRTAKFMASNDFQTAMAALTGWLGVVKPVLTGWFGQRWSAAWVQAGFINSKTSLPTRIADRIGLVRQLVSFFTNNPNYEVASLGATAGRGAALLAAVAAAQRALTDATLAQAALDAEWTGAYSALKDTMWSLIKILQASLDDSDPRWLDFGLQMPGALSTPGKPVNVAAQADGTGRIIVSCDAVPLAGRYRWRTRVVGVQADYRLAAGSASPLTLLSGFEPGQAVQILVQAVNGNLQGVASEPVVFTVPPV